MPISSHQIGGFIGGQQAMFGNFASYSHQISPGYGGPPPTYSNPMGGVTGFEAPPPPGTPGYGIPGYEQMGPAAMSAIGNVGMPAVAGAAMLGGAFMPGPVGSFFRGIDPFSRGLSAMGKGLGWQSGAGIGANLSRAASMGAGGIARAGLMGLGSAAVTALPLMAVGGALKYGVGQMIEGAQYQNQVSGFLQNQFRFGNTASESGYGFGSAERTGIGNMLREMGTQEMLSTPQEMLRIMKQGVGMGLFNAVRDAKEFRTRFKEMVAVAKEVATTMSTTLEGAMPFMREARRMGFWTPQDITGLAATTRATAATTGMSVAQVQAMQFQGAQMARQVGAQGVTGAIGMQRTMNVIGGALRSGVMSEREMAEMTGGLQGPEAIQALAQQSQAATTRFAASRRGRWFIAALANRNMQGFDPEKMESFMRGEMSVGQLGGMARRNVAGANAFNFVMNEERLRGQLIERGEDVQGAFIRMVAGERLFDDSNKNQYIIRRLIQRQFGGSAQQADAMAKRARELPRIMREHEARSAASLDQTARDQELAMERGWEGAKRELGKFWERVTEPFKEAGVRVARDISDWYERTADKLWGRVALRNRYKGVTGAQSLALQKAALGDTEAMAMQFGQPGQETGGNVRRVATGLTGAVKRYFGAQTEWELSPGEAGLEMAMRGGKVTDAAAREYLGYKSGKDVEERRSAMEQEMTTLLRQPTTSRFALTMGGGRGTKYAEALVAGIRSGAIQAGPQIRQMLEGLSVKQGAQRLAAMQGAGHRGLATAITFEGEEEGFKFEGGPASTLRQAEQNLQQSEETLARQLTQQGEKGLTKLERMSLWALPQEVAQKFGRSAVSGADIGRLRTLTSKSGSFDDATKFAAMARQADAAGKPKDAARYRARADAILGDLMTDESTPKESREHITRLLEMSPSERISAMGALGKASQDVARLGFTHDVVNRRMERVRDQLSRRGADALEKVEKAGEELTGGGQVRALLAGGQGPEQRMQLLEQLATAAAEGDKKKIGRLSGLLAGLEGAEDIREAIRGGAGVGRAAEVIASGGRGAASAFADLVQGMGTYGGDVKKLGGLLKRVRKGDDTAIQEILKDTGGGEAGQIAMREMLEGVGRGDAAAIRRGGIKAGTRGALAMLSGAGKEADLAADIRLRIKQGEITGPGKKGSGEAMHNQLIMQTEILRQLNNAMTYIAKHGNKGGYVAPEPGQSKPKGAAAEGGS